MYVCMCDWIFASPRLCTGEGAAEVLGPHVQGHVRLVCGHLVTGSVDGEEGQLGALPLGQVAGSLLVVCVHLPRQARDSVSQVPNPGLGAYFKQSIAVCYQRKTSRVRK